MSAQAYVPPSWKTFRTLAQIFVAFGQGSGQLTVSEDAIEAAVANYAEKIESARDWGEAAPTVLGIARVMGQAAAAYALRERRAIITAADYEAARAVIHESTGETLRLMGVCPWPV